MTGIVDGAIGRARMVLAILLCAIIAGTYTYITLPKEADPDIPVPFVGVTVPLEGISPEDAERLLVRPIEQEIQSLEGLIQYDSFSAEGAGQIVLEFEITADVAQAVLDVKDKVDIAKRFFPADAREPIITEVNTALFPVMMVNLYGEAPERGLGLIANELEGEIESLPGVLEANILGQRDEVLEIIVDPVKLETYNISYQEIAGVVAANNRLIAAGQIDTGEGKFAVKVPGLIKTASDALALPIKSSQNAVVTLADIAQVRRTYKDRSGVAKFNGQPSLSIEVVKRPGANILDTTADVRAILETHKPEWPDTVNATVTSDLSTTIEKQLGQLQGSILTAVLLVMIVCIAALGLRSAALVGISIPSSFVLAFLMLGWFGYTINMMVMFGMVIAVGILVDGAIVVVEYADRKMAEGLDRKEAYALAGKRMFWPVVASTATTLAAFVPFLFWDSMPGKFMAYLPITLIFVLTASLMMALIFLPVLGSVIGARPAGVDDSLAALSGVDGDPNEIEGLLGRYVRLSRSLMARPIIVTVVAFSCVAMIFVWFGSTNHKTEFFLDVEPEQAFVFVRAQGSMSAQEELKIVERAEAALLKVEGISSYSLQSGTGGASTFSFDSDGPNDAVGKILIDMIVGDGVHNGRQTLENVRAAMADVPGLITEISPREQGPPQGKDIQVALRSNNDADRREVVSLVRGHLENMTGLREIEDTRPLPGIEYQLQVNRAEAGKFGVDISQVGSAVQLLTNGILVGRYRPDDARDELDIRVRLPEGSRSIEAVDKLRIATPSGNVPLSMFVTRVPTQRVSQIVRRDGKRLTMVRANVVETGTGGARVQELKDWLDTQDIPASVDIKFEGSDEENAEAAAFFGGAMLAALFMMGVILLWEFNNFFQMFLTLTAVIISTAGVLIGIQLYLPYISMLMLGVGVVALAGIVVNNNIVLIDTFNRLLEDGRTPEMAALTTAAQRIRPILLTTFTTICGLLPMMFMLNVDFANGIISQGGQTAEWWVQLATAVVFGLGFSTVMILLVTPVWLLIPSKLGSWRKRKWAEFRKPAADPYAVRIVDTQEDLDRILPAAE